MKFFHIACFLSLFVATSVLAETVSKYENAIPPGSRGNEGGGALAYDGDMPVSSDPAVILGDDGGVVEPYSGMPGVSSGGSQGMPGVVPGYDPTGPVPEPAPMPACGYQDLVGKHMKDVDLKRLKGVVRVLHPNSPSTMDYSPDRVNIIINEQDVIVEVTCG